MSSILRLDDLALREAIALAKRGPRADYTIPQLPTIAPVLTDLIPFYHNAAGNTYQAAISTILGLSSFGTGFYNAQTYGATGNGTTNDSVAIQAALTAGAGGIVFFPPGNYLCGNLTVPANTMLLGTRGSTIVPTAAAATISMAAGGNTIQGLAFLTGALTTGQAMVSVVTGSSNIVTIHDCAFYVTTAGVIAITDGAGGPVIAITQNNFYVPIITTPIVLTAALYPVIANNSFSGFASASSYCIALTTSAGATVTGNTISGTVGALVNIPSGSADLVCVGNNCEGNPDVADTSGLGTASLVALNNGTTTFNTPAVPLSTSPATNTSGRPMMVVLFGGTVTVVTLNTGSFTSGSPQGLPFFVKPQGTIAVTYSGAPTWTWTPVV